MNFNFFGKTTLTYIANSGVMLSSKGRKIIIDGVHTQAQQPYFSVPKGTIDMMAGNKKPFEGVNIFIFTHCRRDHFDAVSVNSILRSNKRTQVMASEECIELMRKEENFSEAFMRRIKVLCVEQGAPVQLMLSSVPLEVFSLPCDNSAEDAVSNYAYMLEMNSKTFLFTGDAYPNYNDFSYSGILKRKIDYTVVPFTFIGSADGRKILDEMVPEKTFVCHLPNKKYDKNSWIDQTAKLAQKYSEDIGETILLTKPGSEYKL